MKKRLILFIISMFIGFPLVVFAGGSNDDKVEVIPTVKCTYDIYSSLDNRFLTEVYVYFNPEEDYVSKVTHADKNGKETNFAYIGETNFKGYKSGDFGLAQVITWYTGYIDSYNQEFLCPDVYTFRVTEGAQAYTIAPTADVGNLQGYVYKKAVFKGKATSKDGVNWVNSENNTSDDEEADEEEKIIKKSCSYSFGTDIGLDTFTDHFNMNFIVEKIENKITNKTSYNFIINEKSFNNINDIDGKGTWQDLFEIGKTTETAGNSVITVISEQTIKDIVDGDDCLSYDKVYSYREPENRYGDITLVITTDRKEAEDSEENIYNGDSAFDNTPIEIPDLPDDGDTDVSNCELIPQAVKEYITQALRLIRWIGLVLMIILGVLDFTKAVASDDQEAVKKAWQKVIKRLIAVIILFLLPMLVELILDLVNLNNGCKIET